MELTLSMLLHIYQKFIAQICAKGVFKMLSDFMEKYNKLRSNAQEKFETMVKEEADVIEQEFINSLDELTETELLSQRIEEYRQTFEVSDNNPYNYANFISAVKNELIRREYVVEQSSEEFCIVLSARPTPLDPLDD